MQALPPYAGLAQGVPQLTPLLLPLAPTTHFLGFSAGAAGFSSAAGAGAASSAGLGLGLGLALGFSAGAAPGCSPANTFYKIRTGKGQGIGHRSGQVPSKGTRLLTSQHFLQTQNRGIGQRLVQVAGKGTPLPAALFATPAIMSKETSAPFYCFTPTSTSTASSPYCA